MAQISSQPLDKKTRDKVYNLLFLSLTDPLITQKQHKASLNEILTKTEKIMIGKRLAAISLLSQGMSTYKTSKILRLSESTTNKFLARIEKGQYKHTEKLCEIYRKGPLGRYLENLFKPLPKYGTSPSSLFKQQK